MPIPNQWELIPATANQRVQHYTHTRLPFELHLDTEYGTTMFVFRCQHCYGDYASILAQMELYGHLAGDELSSLIASLKPKDLLAEVA